MEGDARVQLVDDNCSQIERAFKRMKVGTRTKRAGNNDKNHPCIYYKPILDHPINNQHEPQQLLPSPDNRNQQQYYQLQDKHQQSTQHQHRHQQQQQPNQVLALHTEHNDKPFHLNQNNNNYPPNQSKEDNKYEDGPPADPDVSVEELAAYLDVQLNIPRKMSYMAELMYT